MARSILYYKGGVHEKSKLVSEERLQAVTAKEDREETMLHYVVGSYDRDRSF